MPALEFLAWSKQPAGIATTGVETSDKSSSPSCKSLMPIEETKRVWRKEQIAAQRRLNREIESSWRQQQTSSWCGWLLKRNNTPFVGWNRRWFELRPPLAEDLVRKCVPLHYVTRRKRGTEAPWQPKALLITSIRRRPELDSAAGVILSVSLLSRAGGALLLAAAKLHRLLKPPTSSSG